MSKVSKKNLQLRLNRYVRNGMPKRFKYLGSGISREVYFDPRTKIAFKVGDCEANLTEWTLWNALPKSHRAFFAKVYGISNDGTVLAMQYIERTWNNSPTLMEELDRPTRKLLCDIGLHDMMGDIHEGNIGLDVNNHIKVIDYGAFQICFDEDENFKSQQKINLQNCKRYLKRQNFKKHKIQRALVKGVFK